MNMKKQKASLSLDLDNKWSYMKTHGDAGWEAFPSYLSLVVPRVLRFLAERRQKITFFIVGQDAAIAGNQPYLRAISAEGHEIGNHSFRHEPWLHLYSHDELEREIASAEEQIEAVTGQRTIGFRGPGYSTSDNVLSVLASRGYIYDASTLPTFIGPMARAYYFLKSKTFTAGEREQRKILFGTWKDGLRTIDAHLIRAGNENLVEIPVTTMPVFRVPMHISYCIYISTFSRALGRAYFRSALALCQLTRTEPSLLLHPLDFLGRDDVPDLAFFPGMNMDSGLKLEIVSDLLDMYCGHYAVSTMREHAAAVLSTNGSERVDLAKAS